MRLRTGQRPQERKLPPHEMRYAELVGVISINLEDNEDFTKLCSSISGFDENRFEAVALKVYISHKPVVTVYALDKARKKSSGPGHKLPVHKFKTEMTLDDLFYHLRNLNFTVSTGDFDLKEMEVTNK